MRTFTSKQMEKVATLLLDDGTVFEGRSIGDDGMKVGEVVFNTAMTGYQEILTDPSYANQIICLTSAHIGNTGTNQFDQEADRVHATGLVVRDAPLQPASWRNEEAFADWLVRKRLVAMSGVDTRRLTRHLRIHGARNGVIYDDSVSREKAEAALRAFPGLGGMDLASAVTTSKAYQWRQTRPALNGKSTAERTASSQVRKHKVVAYDYGIKQTILALLVEHGCDVHVVPAHTSAADVMALAPDGVFLSNGPGDPQPCDFAITAIQQLLDEQVPLFGICLGHQLLSLACGAATTKMKFGHHGANHPVLELATGKVVITSQNHGFCVDEKTLPDCLEATHRSLFDGSLQGVNHRDKPAFGFQGHPEASPGPHDIAPLFERFSRMMRRH